MVIIENGCSIYVKPLAQTYDNSLLLNFGGKLTNVFGVNSDDVIITTDLGDKIEVHLPSYVKSRRSSSVIVTRKGVINNVTDR